MREWFRLPGAFGVALVVGLFSVAPARAQVTMASDAVRIDLGGRLQLQAATSSCSDYTTGGDPESRCTRDVPAVDAFARRIRLRVDVDFNRWISARFQPDFGQIDGVRLADAYGRLNLNPDAANTHAQITVGHFKRPFDGFTLVSSTQFLTIERAVSVPGLTSPSLGSLVVSSRLGERDIGAMVDGGTPDDRFHYWVGLFNGNLPTSNSDENGGKQIVGRAQLKLTAGAHPLKIAVAGTVADQPFERADGSLGGKSHGALEAFAELGDDDGGLHIQAGVISGKNTLQNPFGEAPDLPADEDFAGMLTWQAIGSWRIDLEGGYFVEAVEPVFRLMMADPNRDLDDDVVWGFTPGVQLFFDARNKLAVNWDFVSLADGRSENSFKAQYQFYF